ncbi:hypothetical protein L9F63_023604, partial [Diploptera punctata]
KEYFGFQFLYVSQIQNIKTLENSFPFGRKPWTCVACMGMIVWTVSARWELSQASAVRRWLHSNQTDFYEQGILKL